MLIDDIRRVYARYAGIYDLLFGLVFAGGRSKAVGSLELVSGASVLEVGVGTGLSLPYYPQGIKIKGIDLSAPMLAKARQKKVRADVELFEMNAQALEFEPHTFDASVAMYVVSVAPDPAAVVREMVRVTRPGGQVVFVNHFSHRGHWTAWLEGLLHPLSRRLGWRPLFYLDEFLGLLPAKPEKVISCGLGGYWTLLVCRTPGEGSKP